MSQISFDPLTGNMVSTTAQVAQLDSSGQISGAMMRERTKVDLIKQRLDARGHIAKLRAALPKFQR